MKSFFQLSVTSVVLSASGLFPHLTWANDRRNECNDYVDQTYSIRQRLDDFDHLEVEPLKQERSSVQRELQRLRERPSELRQAIQKRKSSIVEINNDISAGQRQVEQSQRAAADYEDKADDARTQAAAYRRQGKFEWEKKKLKEAEEYDNKVLDEHRDIKKNRADNQKRQLRIEELQGEIEGYSDELNVYSERIKNIPQLERKLNDLNDALADTKRARDRLEYQFDLARRAVDLCETAYCGSESRMAMISQVEMVTKYGCGADTRNPALDSSCVMSGKTDALKAAGCIAF